MIHKLKHIDIIYLLFAHFDVFQLTRSVRQFEFEKKKIQEKKYFMQPGLYQTLFLIILVGFINGSTSKG